ncbi:MAG: hypothetical protein A2X58_12330 [Nitrospirae bacterium GWC2_56_14]|nr:MAG: hypothetical protein A2X58_12330 [Nitrospirae bacterium GWC2_56_14]
MLGKTVAYFAADRAGRRDNTAVPADGGKAASMKVAHFTVDKNLCGECSLALRRFIGGMDGVDSIEVESGRIAVTFNEAEIEEETLSNITRDSIEKLGYKIEG